MIICHQIISHFPRPAPSPCARTGSDGNCPFSAARESTQGLLCCSGFTISFTRLQNILHLSLIEVFCFVFFSLPGLLLSLPLLLEQTRCGLAAQLNPCAPLGPVYCQAEPITNSQDEIILLFISSLQAHNQQLGQMESFSLNSCKH